MQGRGQLSAVIQAMLDYQEIKKAIIEKVLDVFLREAKITQKNASPSVPFSWLLLLLFFISSSSFSFSHAGYGP